MYGFVFQKSTSNYMSNIGAKYVPPSLKKPLVNAIANSSEELFPQILGTKVRTGGFSYAALLKPKETPKEDKSAFTEINVNNNAICPSCHTNHNVCVIDISKTDKYVRDPYYKGSSRWTKRPPTAMKKRTLFEDAPVLDYDESILDGHDSFVEELSVDSDSGSEPYEFEEH